ncbi:MAG TPA: AI-2E family transporter [Termitinemataceae bacterium]|nr:AI-2E family transporter [Termitinemataceae bacterium]HPQ00237.1 AI-2E family transporter [Termitinemataceae bacterium]
MKDRNTSSHSGRFIALMVSIIAVILCGAVIKVTAPVLVPLVVAILLSFALEPLVQLLEKIRVPRLVAILVGIISVAGVFYLFGVILISSASTISRVYPKYERRFLEIYASIAGLLGLPFDAEKSFLMNLWSQLGIRSLVGDMALKLSSILVSFLSNLILVMIFVIFFMAESAHFFHKVELAFMGKVEGKIKKMTTTIINQVSRYLFIKFCVSLATGLFVAIGLYVIGVDFAFLWGVISFVLNFIPTIGSILASVGASVFSLIQFWPEPAPVIGTIAVMVGVNTIIGNGLEPKIQGDNLGLSPLVVVSSLTIWGWLWGFAGLVLAVPLTVIVKIVCDHVPLLEPISIILGSYREVGDRGNKGTSSDTPAEVVSKIEEKKTPDLRV